MTRKKFIKKLMGIGLSRNEANRIAIKSRESGLPYREYYEYECSWLRISNAMEKLGDSFKNASESIKLVNSTMLSFSEAMCAVAQSN